MKHDRRTPRPGERAGELYVDPPVVDRALRDIQAVDADTAASRHVDDRIAQIFVVELDARHAAARAPVKTADAPPSHAEALVGPILGW